MESEGDLYQIREFVSFVAKHPAYEAVFVKEPKAFRYLGARSTKAETSPITAVNTGLEQGIARELRAASGPKP
jgi:hypothetical protein